MIIFLSVLIALIIYFYANINGLGFTNDSVKYWEKSLVFAENFSFREIGFTGIFPFQSLEIVLLAVFGDNALTTMKYLHAILLGGTIIIHLIIAREILSTAKTRIIYAIILVFSTPLLMVHSFLWTEPLFIFLISLQWYLLWRFFQHKSLKTIMLLLLISVLYSWQRKAGMLFSLGLILALATYFSGSKKQLLAISLSLLAIIFVLYGGLGSANLIGELPAMDSIPLNLKNYFGAFSGWILPLPLNFWVRVGLLLIILMSTGYALGEILPKLPESKKAYITSILIITLTYFIVRHIYHRPHADEADRFLAPVYPGIFFLIIFVIDQITLKARPNIRRLVFSVMLSAWLVYPIVRTFKNADLWHNRTKNPLLIKEKTQPTLKK